MNSVPFYLEAANVALGLPAAEHLPAGAVQALVEGYDSPALRILAGLTETQMDEAVPLFKRVLRELGLSLPDRHEAALRLVRELAAKILRRELPPYEGAKEIWQLARATEVVLSAIDPFIYTASEWEDRPEDRLLLEQQIMEEARGLVGVKGATDPERQE